MQLLIATYKETLESNHSMHALFYLYSLTPFDLNCNRAEFILLSLDWRINECQSESGSNERLPVMWLCKYLCLPVQLSGENEKERCRKQLLLKKRKKKKKSCVS